MSETVKNPLLPLPIEHGDQAWTAERLAADPDGFQETFNRLDDGTITEPGPYFETTPRDPDALIEIRPFNARPKSLRRITVLPQRIKLSKALIETSNDEVRRYVDNFPVRNTLAHQLFDVPAAWLAAEFVLEIDGVDADTRPEDMDASVWEGGKVRRRTTEWDCQAAYIGGALQRYHPVGFSHFASFQAAMKDMGRPMRRFEFRDNEHLYYGTAYDRIHDDGWWLSEWDIDEPLDEVSLVVRARRWERGAKQILQMTDVSNLLTGSELRDYKGTLAAKDVELAMLMHDPEATGIALQMLRKMGRAAFVKTAYGARKEGAWAAQSRGRKKEKGERSVNNIVHDLEHSREDGQLVAMPAVIQPRYRPCTMANLGFQFASHDQEYISWQPYARYGDRHVLDSRLVTGEDVFATPPTPGRESEYFGLVRVLYLAQKPGRYEPKAGVIRFRNNSNAIHGASDVFTAMVDIEGVEALPPVSMMERGYHGIY